MIGLISLQEVNQDLRQHFDFTLIMDHSDCSVNSNMMADPPYSLGKRKTIDEIDDDIYRFSRQDSLDSSQPLNHVPAHQNATVPMTMVTSVHSMVPVAEIRYSHSQLAVDQTVDNTLGKAGGHSIGGKATKKIQGPQPRQLRAPKPDSIPWEEWLSVLRSYGETLGHCNAARTCTIRHQNGRKMKIGEWLHTQRNSKRDGRLPPDRLAAMQVLVDEGKLAWSLHWNVAPRGVGLTPNDLRWEARYQELLQYGAAHGEYNVPYQRTDCTKAKKRQGQPVGSSSSSSSSSSSTLASSSTSSLPSAVPVDGDNVGQGGQGVLGSLGETGGQGEHRRLGGLGGQGGGFIACSLGLDSSRNPLLDQGKALSKIAGLSKEQVPLGKWLKKQRQHRQDGAIRPDREAKLQALADLGEGKFKWSAKVSKVNNHDDKKWSQNMDMLIAYGLHRGGGPGCCDVHTNISVVNRATGESKHLGLWIKRQKRQYLRGLLRAERLERLQQLVNQGLLTWDFPEPYKKGEHRPDKPVLISHEHIPAYMSYLQGDATQSPDGGGVGGGDGGSGGGSGGGGVCGVSSGGSVGCSGGGGGVGMDMGGVMSGNHGVSHGGHIPHTTHNTHTNHTTHTAHSAHTGPTSHSGGLSASLSYMHQSSSHDSHQISQSSQIKHSTHSAHSSDDRAREEWSLNNGSVMSAVDSGSQMSAADGRMIITAGMICPSGSDSDDDDNEEDDDDDDSGDDEYFVNNAAIGGV